MKDITNQFDQPYLPTCQLVIYRCGDAAVPDCEYYIESFDINSDGDAINAHPLTIKEGAALANALSAGEDQNNTFLLPESVIDDHILHLKIREGGSVIWYTGPQKVNLWFKDQLNIPNGPAWVPGLLWKATKETLWIYALNIKSRPKGNTKLYHAPFFNIYEDGRVCMGNVKVKVPKTASLESFTSLWQNYFFNSYFSHMIQPVSPVNANIVQLWQSRMAVDTKFPAEVLKQTGFTLKKLIR